MSLIRNDYVITPYQAGKWILELSGAHFIVNAYTKSLIDILSTQQNYTEALEKFNLDFSNTLTENEFTGFIETIFTDIPIFKDSSVEAKAPKGFIKFQKKILSPFLAGKIASFISFLFNKKLFWIFFPVLSLAGIFLAFNTPISSLNNISPVWILMLYTVTMFLHELGHIAACRKFTGKNGEIGFGIYFIFPVLYSNISSVWHANKQERIITNLAGVYMQLWCMLIFYGFYWVTQNTTSLYLAYFITLYSFIQIIPFIRSDGYWLLSDITSTPNLLEKSGTEVKNFIKNPIDWVKETREKKSFLLLYGLFNNAILLYFIITQLVYNWKGILHFPVAVLQMVKQMFTFHFSEIILPDNFMITVVFYILLFNTITVNYKKIFSPDKKRDR
ncbi:hypothetical protein IW15_03380 [Chryseobacterium soli]|uniref:Peptidase M50 n=1 Tax=Chryseobacterium soli TaxID=445961 RepID=A0A086ACS3_9FLAO|nr:hypothetical protein [Chryseobacterium soli]KFF14487.1 hypothetical protein IW15_03380 [Chryseobacterium soli]